MSASPVFLLVPRWRALGLHWHGYHLPGLGLQDPVSERDARLGGERGGPLWSPVQAAVWLAEHVVQEDGSVYIWNADGHRWEHLCPVGQSATVRAEVVSRVILGRSVYAGTRSKWGNHTFAIEAVFQSECTGRHTS